MSWPGELQDAAMKIITLSEAKAHLSRYGELCQKEPIIVTVKGEPVFQISPLNGEGGFMDRLNARNPQFRKLLQSRLKEPTISAAEALQRLK
jgi:antitoxin (DNA-binding transcriptional repressor) of toxin-antitoxin stability system